ncbi:dTDP-4-dehydrorhamnose reductase [Shewanella fodinae]|uniref:dTDP-4-dehydrorhamnose reductase n=1 Tax=Shewanella fodinae TaxID=552357 RepID=A0A4R2F0K4_9GAMM|nr:dTDP-4-dehydrorhamnose reductase [Shewanella fodinae]TCN77389.1 dTDP-4-dehydrorhamnose reductase [Shewanella fodinae]
MKILITGSNGQVGSCLVNRLQLKPEIEFLALTRQELDITDPAQVDTIVKHFNPDVIINAAAYTAVDKAEQEADLCYAINRDGPRFLAEAAHKNGALLLHISTDYVFSGEKQGVYDEEDPVAPQGVYGQSKLAGELAIVKICPRHIILRTAWVFGEHGGNFVKTMLRLAKTRDSIGVVADQFGGPTYAGDIADTLIAIVEKVMNKGVNVFGVFHFSGLPHVSWHIFAQKIFEKAEEQHLLDKIIVVNPISTSEYPTPAKRPSNSRLSNIKLNNVYGIKPSDWQKALTDLSNYK